MMESNISIFASSFLKDFDVSFWAQLKTSVATKGDVS